jgi:hypothetical protein
LFLVFPLRPGKNACAKYDKKYNPIDFAATIKHKKVAYI